MGTKTEMMDLGLGCGIGMWDDFCTELRFLKGAEGHFFCLVLGLGDLAWDGSWGPALAVAHSIGLVWHWDRRCRFHSCRASTGREQGDGWVPLLVGLVCTTCTDTLSNRTDSHNKRLGGTARCGESD